MIPLVTDLNRSATMTHQLNDTTPEFEVGDRVRLNHTTDFEAEGRVVELMGEQVLVNFRGFPRRVYKDVLTKID